MTKNRKEAYLALFVTAFLWGIAPPIIKYTLNFLSPLSFLYYRFLLASIIFALPFFLQVKKIKPPAKDWLKYLALGFLATPLNLLLLFYGIQKTTSLDAAIISIVSPILVVIGGVYFLKEKLSSYEKKGVILILLGTFLTIIQPLFEKGLDLTQNLEGNLLVFLGAVVWAVFTLWAKKEKGLDPLILSSSSFFVGLIILSPLPLISSLPTLTFRSPALPGILYMAVFSSVVAYFAYTYGLSKIEASEAEIFTYLQAVFAAPVSVIFLGEKVSFPYLLGAVLILGGVFVCQFLGRKRPAAFSSS